MLKYPVHFFFVLFKLLSVLAVDFFSMNAGMCFLFIVLRGPRCSFFFLAKVITSLLCVTRVQFLEKELGRD